MDINDLKSRMEGAVSVLSQEFNGLRTGRATPDLLAPVSVEAYEGSMPLDQVGSVSAPDARTLSIQVWDTGLIGNVEKAIQNSGLGLNPMTEGNVIRINLPELNEERRQELSKIAKKYAENARVSVRNVRRDGMEILKKEEKDGNLSEDESHRMGEQVQQLTDSIIAKIDEALGKKEKDIMQV